MKEIAIELEDGRINLQVNKDGETFSPSISGQSKNIHSNVPLEIKDSAERRELSSIAGRIGSRIMPKTISLKGDSLIDIFSISSGGWVKNALKFPLEIEVKGKWRQNSTLKIIIIIKENGELEFL